MLVNKGFVYSDLFKLLPQSEKVSKLDFVECGRTPAYSSDTSNNGCLGFVDKEPLFKISEERPVYLIFGDHTKTMNIVHNDFCVMDNVKVLIPKVSMSDEILLYVTTAWKKAIPNLGYARHWSMAQAVLIQLPVIENPNPDHEYTVDDIDWQYMRDRITELERDRITELDAYLQATGLDDYELTEDDKKVLSEKVDYGSFSIGDVFQPLKVGFIGKGQKIGSATKEPDYIHCIPLTCAKIGDNGIMYWGKKGDFITYTNALSVIADGAVAAGLVYAHPEEAGAYSHSYFIDTKEKNVSKYAKQYLSSVLTKVIYPKYSRENPPHWNKIGVEEISLPIKSDGTLDFNYMARYIRALEKVVIADVVKYKDKVIAATKKTVGE